MNLFPVYPVFDISLVKGNMSNVFDANGNKYLDLYGGHAVISVGHNHPDYVSALKQQMEAISYYSNSVKLPIQNKLANKLGKASRYYDYRLFLCNSGAEAVENALKVASFHTKKRKIICFEGAFHGRTSGALAVTDNPSIRSPFNDSKKIIRLPFNGSKALKMAFKTHKKEIAGAIIEPIQGVSGIMLPDTSFIHLLERLCLQNGTLLIADEVQSGFGRSGKFFAHQHFNVQPHIITMAKGMGNGFPVGGILIHPDIKASFGMLGTTFGGNPLACAATIAVLDIIKKESLKQNAKELGLFMMKRLSKLKHVKEVRGLGLMIGIEFDFSIKKLRSELLFKHKIFTGNAKNPNVLRILPPLNIKKKQLLYFLEKLEKSIKNQTKKKYL